ncbi:MAG: alpha/beta hydrolase [Sphingomonadaceae bacterium]
MNHNKELNLGSRNKTIRRQRIWGTRKSGLRYPRVALASLVFLLGGQSAMADQATANDKAVEKPLLNPDGSLNVDAFELPFSVYASPEAKEEQAQRLKRLNDLRTMPPAAKSETEPDHLHKPWYDAQKRRYPVTMKEGTIGGIGVQVFEPMGGVKPENAHRVLINLHGGAFMYGWPFGSQIESIPVASVGGIRVISVNYRMAPKSVFPAASEDVAAVYSSLLKTHKPSQIGIYGCSAGGILAGQAAAWFDRKGLPQPAGLGIASGFLTLSMSGDSAYITPHFGGFFPTPDPNGPVLPYFNGTDLKDPLASPAESSALLAKFPPTLLATGTRAADMSVLVKSHMDLVQAGADARLFLWDGLEHCFMYNPDMPESQQFYKLLTDFFDDAMDRADMAVPPKK